MPILSFFLLSIIKSQQPVLQLLSWQLVNEPPLLKKSSIRLCCQVDLQPLTLGVKMSNLRLPDALELPDTEGGHQLPGSQLRTEPQTLSLGSCRRPESSKNLFNLFLERSCLQENDNLSEYPPFLARPGPQAKSLKNLAEESQVVSVAGWPQVVCLPVGGWLCVSQWNQIMESPCTEPR